MRSLCGYLGGVLSLLISACSSDAAIVVAPSCGALSFPSGPDGATVVLHVAASCPMDGADGSAAHPYTTIGAALTAAGASGATVVVAAGSYDEGLDVTHGVSIYGSDASSTDPGGAAASINSVSINVSGAQPVVIHGLHVVSAVKLGVLVEQGTVTIEASQVTATQRDASGAFGYGIEINAGVVALSHSQITGSASTGVSMYGGTATLTGNTISQNAGGGFSALAASATLDQNTLDGNTTFGVGAFSAQLTLTANTITNTQATGVTDPKTMILDDIADGILARSAMTSPSGVDTTVTATGNTITGADRVGVLFGAGASGALSNNQIMNNGFGTHVPVNFGAGVWMQTGAGGPDGVMLTGNTVTGNAYIGVGLTTKASAQLMANPEISSTVAMTSIGLGMNSDSGRVGDGIGVYQGSNALITQNGVHMNGRCGILTDAATSTTTISANDVGDNVNVGIAEQDFGAQPIDLSTNSADGNDQGDSAGPQQTEVIAPTGTLFFVQSAEFILAGPTSMAP